MVKMAGTIDNTVDDLFDELFDDEPFNIRSLSVFSRSRKEVISESDLKTFFKCPYSYYLKKHLGLTKIPRSAFAAQALFFSQARKRLFNLRDAQAGRIFSFQSCAGPELKTADEMTAAELSEYLASSSPEKFGGSLFGTWLQIAKRGVYAGSDLSWNFASQPYLGAKQLRTAGENYYRFVLSQGAPVLGFLDKELPFEFNSHLYAVKFPEIRPGLIIDDPTLWGFNLDFEKDKVRSDIETSSLVTLRVLAFQTLVYHYPLLRIKFGVDDALTDSWGEGLDERITYRHFNATRGLFTEARRNSKHLDKLKQDTDTFLERAAKEEFPPRRERCFACSCNLLGRNGKPVCSEVRTVTKPSVPYYYFRKKAFRIKVEERKDELTLTGLVCRNETLAKTVACYALAFRENGETIRATSSYSSPVRGLGFEEKMLIEADKRLQVLADENKREVVHEINLVRDFLLSERHGTVRAVLHSLGYVGNKKTYKPAD